jgi:hypothetical protein
MTRGYLYGAISCFTNCCSVRTIASSPGDPAPNADHLPAFSQGTNHPHSATQNRRQRPDLGTGML